MLARALFFLVAAPLARAGTVVGHGYITNTNEATGDVSVSRTGIAGQRVTMADPTQGALMWTLNQFLRACAPDGMGLLLSVKGAPVWSAPDPARQ